MRFLRRFLFLGAGSVIHGMHEEQDIWKMGGLKIKNAQDVSNFCHWLGWRSAEFLHFLGFSLKTKFFGRRLVRLMDHCFSGVSVRLLR